MRRLNPIDHWIAGCGQALGAVGGRCLVRPSAPGALFGPIQNLTHGTLGEKSSDLEVRAEGDRQLSAALMRVNHVGEVCAQALYQAQALTARSPALREQMQRAAREEADHLAWTRQRLSELGDRPSLLNPLWFAGAFAIGLAAGRLGDSASLGFVVETERQVEAHLAGHLERLPEGDHASRAIVAQMKADEARHAEEALSAGAAPVPEPVKWLMKAAARVMTTVAHRI